MAVSEIKNYSTLKLNFQIMVDGRSRTKSKSYSYVKNDAPAQDIYDVADALCNLQKNDLADIIKIDNTTLS